MEKTFIKNRKNQNVVVIIEESNSPQGLAFVMHGLGGYKEELHIETFAKAFKDNNYTVVRFDTTNTFGESEGDYADATVTNYYADLEDVINRSKTQDFYQEPFILCGHSLGGICTALYAQTFPEKVKALAPISTVVSGEMSKEKYSKQELDERERTGRQIRPRSNGTTKKIKWSHLVDRVQYNLLPKAHLLTMPVLMVVGETDDVTPVEHQQILFDKLPGQNNEIHIIQAAPHTFMDQQHLDEIYTIFDKRIISRQ